MKYASRMSGVCHRQQGQALVLGMLLAGVAAIALLRYFSVGQVVAAKARQLHGLDAAAYSAALVQARALNMLSYINRAQVGHQVAMAHLVTLGSWASLGGTEARQLGTGNPPAYLIAMLFGADHGAAYLAASPAAGMESLAATHGSLASAYAAHDRSVHDVLAAVQNEIVASVPQARLAAARAVLGRHYPESSSFDLAISDDNWDGYVRRYGARQMLRPFILEAANMYGFLQPRNRTASNPWDVQARCPWLRHELRRRGTTELDASGRWQSLDTQSFHALRSNKWIGCYYREYPMGWGWIPPSRQALAGVPHVDDPPENFSAQDFWRWVQQATQWDIVSGDANPLANSKAVAGRPDWPGRGLADYIDIGAEGNSGEALRFAVMLKHPGPQGLTVVTRSAAATFFARPEARQDGRHELPNLFHPYWQARLDSSLSPEPGSGWQHE